jgi:hypothetical protein
MEPLSIRDRRLGILTSHAATDDLNGHSSASLPYLNCARRKRIRPGRYLLGRTKQAGGTRLPSTGLDFAGFNDLYRHFI